MQTVQPKITQPQITTPAIWERLVAALVWCTTLCRPIAILAGLLSFVVWRKRRIYLARHGLWVMICQLPLVVMEVLLYQHFSALLHGVEMQWLLSTVFPTLLRSPGLLFRALSLTSAQFVCDKVALTPVSLLFLKGIIVVFLAESLISLIGMVIALFGSRRRIPATKHADERQESRKSAKKAV